MKSLNWALFGFAAVFIGAMPGGGCSRSTSATQSASQPIHADPASSSRVDHLTTPSFTPTQTRIEDPDWADPNAALRAQIRATPLDERTTPSHEMIYLAAVSTDEELLDLLLQTGHSIDQVEPQMGHTPLQTAVVEGHTTATRFLLDHGADTGYMNPQRAANPLIDAVNLNQTEVVEILLQHDADPNIRDPLYYHRPLHFAATEGHTPIIELLLQYGADPNARNVNGVSPLHLAVNGAHLDAVKTLIQGGAEVNLATNVGTTPMDVLSERIDYMEEGKTRGWKLRPGMEASLLEIRDLLTSHGAKRSHKPPQAQ